MMMYKAKTKIVLRVTAIALVCAFALSGVSFAFTDTASDSALAPPLATKPPCEIHYDKATGTCDVVTNNDVVGAWDSETVRSVKADETLGKSFRNRWAFVDIGYLIGQMLILTQEHKLKNPKNILIPLLKKHIQNRDGMAEILLEGFEIDRIEEMREGQVITGFALPVTRHGFPAYRLIYNLQGGDTAIQMQDGKSVYVKVEGVVYEQETAQQTSPHRLTIDECRQRLLENLRDLRTLVPSLQKEFASGLAILKSEGVDAFEKKAYPRIKEEADKIEVKVSAIRCLPAVFGFSEPEVRGKLDTFLRQIAEEAKVDKVSIWFGGSWQYDFTYTRGFSEQELMTFIRNRTEIFRVITSAKELKAADEKELANGKASLKKCGIVSAVGAVPETHRWLHNNDSRITIVIGRSEECAKTYGELAEQDRTLLTNRLNALIDAKTAPWWGIRDWLKSNGYSDFDTFMMILRHNGSVDVFDVGVFPFIYGHLPQYINKIRANDNESQKWFDSLVRNIEWSATETGTLEKMDTFLQILENGTDFKPRNITQYVRNRVESFRQEAMVKGLTFTTELSDEDLIVSHCDLNLMGVLIDNLIQNAIKYTKQGGIKVRLARKMMKPETGSQEEVESAVLEVEDTGIGIPKDEKSKIFGRGYRASNVADIQGTGIGLDAVSTITYLMRGDVKVESEVGKGTTFMIRLPITPSQSSILPPTTTAKANDEIAILNSKKQSIAEVLDSFLLDTKIADGLNGQKIKVWYPEGSKEFDFLPFLRSLFDRKSWLFRSNEEKQEANRIARLTNEELLQDLKVRSVLDVFQDWKEKTLEAFLDRLSTPGIFQSRIVNSWGSELFLRDALARSKTEEDKAESMAGIERNIERQLVMRELIYRWNLSLSPKTQRLLTMTTKEIPPKTEIGEKPYKLLKMAQAGLNVPPFFVIATNGSGEIIVTDELRSLFSSLKKPTVVRSGHKDEGTTHSFSGVFDSYKGITTIEPTSTEIISDEQEGFWEHGYKPESLQSAYKLILEGATEGYKVKKYLEDHHITDFNPKQMNAVVMEEIDMDVFGMFITSNQNNPDEVLIHYQLINKNAEEQQQGSEDGFLNRRKEMGGVITYNKKTRELGQNNLDEETRSILKQFGEVAGQIEKMFGVQQIELGASKGKVYVFQSRDIDLTNPEDAPRLAHYETMDEELNGIGYGYYHLPVLVIDSLNTARPFRNSDEYRALEAAYMASNEKWSGKEWDALRKFEEGKMNEYREELLRFQTEHPEYILVVKDADAVIDSDMRGKSYDFLNKLASKAKVVVRGRNQRAIRHEDWENVELGAITVIPPEVSGWGGFINQFVVSRESGEHKTDTKFTRPSDKRSNVSIQQAGRIATGDYLNVLSNIDGVFVWSGNPLTSVRSPASEKAEGISKTTMTPVVVSPESERIHTTNFQDTLTYIQAQPQTQPLIVALGTSWIKGYEKGRYLQYDALNPLIGSLRTYCESKGIPFIVDDDDKLLARINAERTKDGKSGAKVVVLAGENTVKSDEFAPLRDDEKNAVVVGVNNQELTTDSYIRLMEMLTLALKLSAGLEVSFDNAYITIIKDNAHHLYIFLPHAQPMDYEQLKIIYEVQKFA